MKKILGYLNSEDDEKQLWNDCIFIFDSSALLNFYEYSEKARQEIFKLFLNKLQNRLWITNHTEYEYLKNKEKVISKPANYYDELIVDFDLKKFQTFKNQFTQLKNKTKKDNKHPYIDRVSIDNFERKFNAFESKLNDFYEALKTEIDLKKKEIEEMRKKDTVLEAFSQLLKVGEGYTFNKLLEIAKEGEFRYRNTIPPGYEDLKEKHGLQIYGDLVIWKQIIDLACSEKKPVILVIDDLKIDWCYKDAKDKNIIAAPREELIKEMLDIGGVMFWSYSSTQFLDKSTKYLGTAITDEVIQEVRTSNQYTIYYQIEKKVYKWAVNYYKSEGEVEYVGEDKAYGVDFKIKSEDGVNTGVEIKYFPRHRSQSIQNLIEHLVPRFIERRYFDTFDNVMIIVACETKELAMKMMLSKEKYETSTSNPVIVKVGFINDEGDFELI